ncbi:polyprenyl synthetase [Natrinema pellirubrum]|uniref:polyprenyl synthetase n=1 Tax=Natrinema pellirubrum TaxID=69525 RepID=UPI001268877E|nr:polyprenyl synthetase [Natrinema pellirubrum]
MDPTAALLTGYYLYTASFSSLGSISGPQSDGCFGVLTTVIETITEAFARTYTSAGSTDCEEAVFLDETAGSLGAGAAALGATLADFDDAVRPHCERLGRNLGTARQFRAIIERDSNKAMVASPTFDESQFRLHAERRRDDVDKALDTLSKTVDVTNLRAFAEATTLRLEQQTSDTNDNTLN